jgi:hypothetical protein
LPQQSSSSFPRLNRCIGSLGNVHYRLQHCHATHATQPSPGNWQTAQLLQYLQPCIAVSFAVHTLSQSQVSFWYLSVSQPAHLSRVAAASHASTGALAVLSCSQPPPALPLCNQTTNGQAATSHLTKPTQYIFQK